ncbi:MAG: hypothetical protein A2Y86_06945 [Candidatus Aminicenantes bacterium RBG_13_62_12]|nr:MAG: hypothetical protein A2Y86_06945 [Candidatus Aminicenantes bacterium RBG_13_62_12]
MNFRFLVRALLLALSAASLSCVIAMPPPAEQPPPPPAEEPAEDAPRLGAPPRGVLNALKPDRFTLNFGDAYLVHDPQSGVLQITAQGNVLSYGSGWTVRKVKSYLYHLRLDTWRDFYWQVNTSRKEVMRVRGGTFGSVLGGSKQSLSVAVDVRGGAGAGEPQQFTLRFPKAYMVYAIDDDELQLIAEGNVLSYCRDWRRCKLNNNLYHFKQKEWDGFFWKVSTASKKAWRCRNGVICQPGGTDQPLSIRVDVTR